MRSLAEMIERVASPSSRAAIERFVTKLGATQSIVYVEPEEEVDPQLADFSLKKLSETWTGRPAQLQVLANICYGLHVTRHELADMKEQMKGRPLRDIASVANGVILRRQSA